MEEYKTLEAYLSTHPGYDDRYKQLQNIIEATLAIRKECGCPELYQESDPCMGASQARKWWDMNKDALVKQEIEAKQKRKLQNKGIALHLPQKEEVLQKQEPSKTCSLQKATYETHVHTPSS